MTPKELVNLPNDKIIEFFKSYKISSKLENFELIINLEIECNNRFVQEINDDIYLATSHTTLYSNIGNIGKGRILKKIGIISATVKIDHKFYPRLEIQVYPVQIVVRFFTKLIRAEFAEGGEVIRIYRENEKYNYFTKRSAIFENLIYKKT